MNRTFRPNRSILLYCVLGLYGTAALLLAVVFSADNSTRDLFEVSAFTLVPITALAAVLFCSGVVISETRLAVTTMLFSRHASDISNIVRVNHRSTFLGGVGIVEVHYRWKFGLNRTMRISVNAYGSHQVAEIVAIIRNRNPHIALDRATERILHR
jgi:hypothetical protein